MLERRQIVELWRSGDPGTLATLVHVVGSSYRQPGARLISLRDRRGHAGTISGGCLETDILRKSEWNTRDGAVVERYSTEFDDTAEIPFGLGCGGTVDVLFEPLKTLEADALLQAAEASLNGCESWVTTYLPGDGRTLQRLVVTDGEVRFASARMTEEQIRLAQSARAPYSGTDRFVERLEAPQRLIVCGAGDDAKPLVSMAAMLGWRVVVVDRRSRLATAERFPQAGLIVSDDAAILESLQIGPRDAVILMTHSYEQDRDFLRDALPCRPGYLGLLGSRHRSAVLVSEAAAMLGVSVETCCENVFAPVGLDIGGEGPEAIALAIVAEVQSVAHHRLGSARRLKASDVAMQIELEGASLYLQTQCGVGG